MHGIIRIGDKTTCGGTVMSGSSAMIFSGIGVARQGDPVMCSVPLHVLAVISSLPEAGMHSSCR